LHINKRLMLKYAVAVDGLKLSAVSLQYATYFSSQCQAFLTGIFLDDPAYTSFHIYDMVGTDGAEERRIHKLKADDRKKRQESAQIFHDTCTKEGIQFNTHHDERNALQDLLNESLFSDLLILNRDDSFSHHEEKIPSRFIRDVLSHADCPVLLTSSVFKPIEKIVFLYDGEASSVYAIKMFEYLLHGLLPLQSEIFCVKLPGTDEHMPFHQRMKELVSKHQGNVMNHPEKGIAADIITAYLKKETCSTLVVLGAYRRSPLSRWFHSSMADVLMQEVDLPLFIAHQK
jgi:nucleotide-binding universal stress UspA family protein